MLLLKNVRGVHDEEQLYQMSYMIQKSATDPFATDDDVISSIETDDPLTDNLIVDPKTLRFVLETPILCACFNNFISQRPTAAEETQMIGLWKDIKLFSKLSSRRRRRFLFLFFLSSSSFPLL